MASTQRSLKIPADLAEGCELRAQMLGYPSWGAYVKGLMRYDQIVQGPHEITIEISKLPLEEQDKLDAKLLEATRLGVGERGRLLARILDRLRKGATIDEAIRNDQGDTPPADPAPAPKAKKKNKRKRSS